MKSLLTALVTASLLGCSSSSKNNNGANNELIGSWLSNCHEFLNTEDQSGNNRYVISEITFYETDYVDNFVSYIDINCTNDPIVEMSQGTYSIGGAVPTTDGVDATRITLSPTIPERPDLVVTFEGVYRISGLELNFGEYIEGEIPTVDARVTHIRQ